MAHRLVRWLGRRALRWFYREVRLIGAEHIPATGPVLLVGNHPNDLPDVLIAYLATDRPVRFIATSAAATSVLVRWTYEGLGVIPVTRVRDALKLRERGVAVDMKEANRQAFAAVTLALNGGALVGIYPEGGVHAGPDIGPMRSGVARVILEGCFDGSIPELSIVPIGVQYESPRGPRSTVCVRIGRPLQMKHWLARNPPKQALFSAELRRLMSEVARTALTDVEADQRDATLAAAGGALADEWAETGPGAVPAVDFACAINEHWRSLVTDPDMAGAVESLTEGVRLVGGRPSDSDSYALMLEVCRSGGAHPRSAKASWRGIVEAPIGALGWAIHAPLWLAAWRLSHRVIEVPSDLAARTIVPGLYLAMLWYVLVTAAVAVLLRAAEWPAWLALLLLVALPRLGDAGMRWRDAIRDLGMLRRTRALSPSDKDAVARAARVVTARIATFEPLEESVTAVQRSVSLTR